MRARPAAIAAVCLALAAGCGSQGASSGSATTAPAMTGSTHYPLTLTQPDGATVVIKAPPRRIVAVDNPAETIDDLVALGVQPIGAELYPPIQRGSESGAAFDSRGIPVEVASRVSGTVADVGQPVSPDLESITALHPDLIVGTDRSDDLAQLEAIAPVIEMNTTPPAASGIDSLIWVAGERRLAQVLDRQTQLNGLLSKIEAAAATTRAAVGGKTAEIVEPNASNSSFILLGPSQTEVSTLRYAGIMVPAIPPGSKLDANGAAGTFSMERASVLTAQYLIVEVGGRGPATAGPFLSNPLVKQLPAVKAGRVIVVSGFNPGYFLAGAAGTTDALAFIQKSFTTTGKAPP